MKKFIFFKRLLIILLASSLLISLLIFINFKILHTFDPDIPDIAFVLGGISTFSAIFAMIFSFGFIITGIISFFWARKGEINQKAQRIQVAKELILWGFCGLGFSYAELFVLPFILSMLGIGVTPSSCDPGKMCY